GGGGGGGGSGGGGGGGGGPARGGAWGRPRPFGGFPAQQQPQPPADNIIQQTFFRQNGQQATAVPNTNTAGGTTLDPFAWPVQYDRAVTSSMDLLHVSGYKPFELTQMFMTGGNPAIHQAPWRFPQTRLYRALELLSAGSFMNQSASGGRVPGKPNINMMPEEEVLLAVADPLPPGTPYQRHYFDRSKVDRAWNVLQQMRQINLPAKPLPIPIMSLGQPFAN